MPNDLTNEVEQIEEGIQEEPVTQDNSEEGSIELGSDPAQPARYPEHEKLSKISSYSQSIGDFMSWANGRGIYLAEYVRSPGRQGEEHFVHARSGIQTLLAEYFGIDRDRLETEKRDMLAQLQSVESTQNLEHTPVIKELESV